MFDVQSVHCSGQAEFHTRFQDYKPDDVENYQIPRSVICFLTPACRAVALAKARARNAEPMNPESDWSAAVD